MDPERAVGVRADLDALIGLAWGDGGAAAVRAYLRARLDAVNAVPYAPRTRDGDLGALVAVLPGREPDRRPLVLTARTDLTGASALVGVAAVLASLLRLADAALERGVLVALFDETGHEGRAAATRWFEEGRRHDVKAAIVVGRLVPGRRVADDDVLAVAGVETDARMPEVLDGAAPPGLRVWPTRHVADGLPFASHAVPYVRIGAPALGPTRRPRVDLTRAAHLGALAADLVVTLATRLDAARLPGPYGGYDSTPYEVAATKRALGPVLADLGGAAASRHDLERIAARLHEA
jgi:hypothetical protein